MTRSLVDLIGLGSMVHPKVQCYRPIDLRWDRDSNWFCYSGYHKPREKQIIDSKIIWTDKVRT